MWIYLSLPLVNSTIGKLQIALVRFLEMLFHGNYKENENIKVKTTTGFIILILEARNHFLH